jgi:deoxyribose-phosphate aldolase
VATISKDQFCSLVDHTLLKSTAQNQEIVRLCQEAIEHQFFAICVNPYFIRKARTLLSKSEVKVATVCDFPLGAGLLKSKLLEAESSLNEGADEIDTVINVGALKDLKYSEIEDEIRSLKKICGPKVLKVILEVCLLTPEEIIKACKICDHAGADFVKTSTGFSTSGATVESVALMRKHFSRGIKASGGIKSLLQAEGFIQAGANRLGLSSSVSILKEF